uniref:Uncharacterized protein n=1 Tax=Anguilla anguilla TaxID=7936 RepID=A0A0E9VB10_ANGAN
MWSGLCAGGSLCQRRCRRTEFLPCDPGTLLFWRRGATGISVLSLLCRKE